MEQKAATLQLQATEARKDRAHTQSRLDQLIFLTEEEDETDTTLQQEVERLQKALDDLHRHTDQRQQSKENTRKELNERLQRAEALLERAETEIHQLTQQMAARRPSELTNNQCLRQLSATTHMLRSQDFNTHCAPFAITAQKLDAVVVREKAATIGHHLTRSGIRHRMERAAPTPEYQGRTHTQKVYVRLKPSNVERAHCLNNSKHSHTDTVRCLSTVTDHAPTLVLAFILDRTQRDVNIYSQAHESRVRSASPKEHLEEALAFSIERAHVRVVAASFATKTGEKVFWPPYPLKESGKVRAAIRRREEPKENWQTYEPVRVLISRDTFEEAERCLERYLKQQCDTTDIQSEEESQQPQKRRKK
ncbi:unnamed protein product [Leuciscus chuanchicus]